MFHIMCGELFTSGYFLVLIEKLVWLLVSILLDFLKDIFSGWCMQYLTFRDPSGAFTIGNFHMKTSSHIIF